MFKLFPLLRKFFEAVFKNRMTHICSELTYYETEVGYFVAREHESVIRINRLITGKDPKYLIEIPPFTYAEKLGSNLTVFQICRNMEDAGMLKKMGSAMLLVTVEDSPTLYA